MERRRKWLIDILLGCSVAAAGLALANPPHSHVDHLDLQVPPDFVASPNPTPLPSLRRSLLGSSTVDRLREALPALGADKATPPSMSKPEELVRRFHREGLPVARLWESHNALVSLGLNSHGKPGIWLVQKIK
jgi:hypothetical protein